MSKQGEEEHYFTIAECIKSLQIRDKTTLLRQIRSGKYGNIDLVHIRRKDTHGQKAFAVSQEHFERIKTIRDKIPLCACNCGQKVDWNGRHGKWNTYRTGHQPNDPVDAPLCLCGCGELTTWNRSKLRWNAYVHGHRVRKLWQDPDYREMWKQKWSDPKYRQHMVEKAREQWQGTHGDYMREVQRKRNERLWNDPKFRQKMRRVAANNMRDFNKRAWKDPAYRERMRQAGIALWKDPAFGEMMRQKSREKLADPDVRAAASRKISDAQRKHWQDPEYRAKMDKVCNSDEYRDERRRRWKNPDFVSKCMEALGRSPNNLEFFFDRLTSSNIRYVGDHSWWRCLILSLPNGEYIRKYKNPDFKVTGQNKVVEVFGDFWHQGEYPQDLIDAYNDAGIECLIIWEHELYEDTEEVLDKVAAFVGEESWQMSLPLG